MLLVSLDVLFQRADYLGIDDATKRKLEFEREWFSNMMKEFVKIIYKIPAEGEGKLAY